MHSNKAPVPSKSVLNKSSVLVHKPEPVHKQAVLNKPVHKASGKVLGSSFVAAGMAAGSKFLVHMGEGMGVHKARDMPNDMTKLVYHIYQRCRLQLLLASPGSKSIEREKSYVAFI